MLPKTASLCSPVPYGSRPAFSHKRLSLGDDGKVHYRLRRPWPNPEGVSVRGEDIPLPARIIAVADAYDAMTSSRPYRPAMAHNEAVAELRREAGQQLDAEVVVSFLRVIERRGRPAGGGDGADRDR